MSACLHMRMKTTNNKTKQIQFLGSTEINNLLANRWFLTDFSQRKKVM